MIKGIGIDITEIARIKSAMERNAHFAARVLTKNELEIYNQYRGRRQLEFLAGRFSLKESFAKAIGTGIGAQVALQDIETLDDELGKPVTTCKVYHGRILASISHSENNVVTEILLED